MKEEIELQCPNCNTDAIFEVTGDSGDDGELLTTQLVRPWCNCEWTAEQWDALENEAVETAVMFDADRRAGI